MTRLRVVVAALGAVAVLLLGVGTLQTTSSAWTDHVFVKGTATGLIVNRADFIAAGTQHSCGIVGGKVYCWGASSNGRLGVSTPGDALAPVGPVLGPLSGKNVVAVTAGNASTCAVAAGAVYCWGSNDSNQLGNYPNINSPSSSLTPVAVTTASPSALAGRTVTSVNAGNIMICALTADGRVACWGSGAANQIAGASGTTPALPVLVPTVAEQASSGGKANQLPAGTVLTHESTGWDSSCATSATAAWCWGDQNFDGRLGDGTTTPSTVPRQVLLPAGAVTAITTGLTHSCAIVAGKAYCWGSAQSGALGNGVSSGSFPTPVAVDTTGVLAGVTLVDIDAGEGTTCARSATGSLYCWGDNSNGQLGIGSNTNQSVPAALVTSNMTSGSQTSVGMAFGQFHGCEVSATNAFYCWGNGDNGRLGSGSTAWSNIPVPVAQGAIP